jgi:hypothetical protein
MTADTNNKLSLQSDPSRGGNDLSIDTKDSFVGHFFSGKFNSYIDGISSFRMIESSSDEQRQVDCAEDDGIDSDDSFVGYIGGVYSFGTVESTVNDMVGTVGSSGECNANDASFNAEQSTVDFNDSESSSEHSLHEHAREVGTKVLKKAKLGKGFKSFLKKLQRSSPIRKKVTVSRGYEF